MQIAQSDILALMKRPNNAFSTTLPNNDNALSRQEPNSSAEDVIAGELDEVAKGYLAQIATQTRGSYRVKRANALGAELTKLLKLIGNGPANQNIADYIERAQSRVDFATRCRSGHASQGERNSMVLLYFERRVLEIVLELDKMEAIGAIYRVRRCGFCKSWLWGRVKNQRYCSEKCRVRHFHLSVDGKKYKREWARKAYHASKRRSKEEARQFAILRPSPQLRKRSSNH
jgi:hypothetical protein